jgi:hypothetical protein
MAKYVIIESNDGIIHLLTDEETGEAKIFDSKSEAEDECEQCRSAQVVRLYI